MITYSGKEVGSFSSKEIEIEVSVATPPEKEVEKEASYVAPPPYKPIVPFLQRLLKAKVEAQFKKFMELTKKIHLYMPFTEVLAQIPSYGNLLKEILSNKRKLEDYETMDTILNSSVVIQNIVIPKL